VNDININGAIWCIIAGLIFTLASKQLAKLISDLYSKLLGIRSSEKVNRLIIFWVGIFFIILGILVVLKII
jgi:hypothetical protein